MRKLPQIKSLREEVDGCEKCPLHKTRRHGVCDSGPLDAKIMLIGEAPGEIEDLEGEPFRGKCGTLLDWALKKAGTERRKCYVTNVLKSRPPKNKIPDDEGQQWVAACRPYLIRQIQIIRPAIIVTLGKLAAKSILNTNGASMGSLVGGEFKQYDDVIVIPTWHPSYVLRKGNKKDLVKHLRHAVKLIPEGK